MSNIGQLLREKVDEFKQQSSSEEASSWGHIKAAATQQLVDNGVPKDSADIVLDELAKKAGITDSQASQGSFSINVEQEVLPLLEKTAHYVSELEAKIGTDNEHIQELQEQLEKAAEQNHQDAVEVLKEKGFSEEDAENLVKLPGNTLEKIASMASGEPWDLGSGARQAADTLDPLEQFVMS